MPCMALETSGGQMVRGTLANMSTIRRRAKALSFGLMEVNTKASGMLENSMELVNSFLPMASIK